MERGPDYSKGLIYKLYCRDSTIQDVDIGSTVDFDRRQSEHQKHSNHEKCKDCYPVYDFIRSHGGWSNWIMVLVELFPCETEYELHVRERYYIELLNASLNINIPTRTPREYYEDNREIISEKAKIYRAENKEEFAVKDADKYQRNRERRIEQAKEYYVEHREKIMAHRKEVYVSLWR